jgi:tRNA pseudouridine13 synthase
LQIKKRPEDFVVEEVISVTHNKDDCLVFTLEKKNWDTIGAVKAIARALKVSQKRLGYAGLKDKRAVTRQKVSVTGVGAEALTQVTIPGITITDIEQGDCIHLGGHTGNMFDILVRDVELPENIHQRIKRGFPNYFGEQRFGKIRPITHEVGKALIQNDLEKAALIFLAKPFLKDPNYKIRKALWETKDFQTAKKEFPLSLKYERAMLNSIHKGYKKAFEALPVRLNMLFIHAYQAYLFNKIIKKRIQEVPIHVVEPKDVVVSQFKGKTVMTVAGPHNMDMITKNKLCAAAPIIGYKTQVWGRMKYITEDVLHKEEIKKGDFTIKAFPRLSSRGTYRQILGKASHVVYDLEKEGVKIRFFLPKGQYATVFLNNLFNE